MGSCDPLHRGLVEVVVVIVRQQDHVERWQRVDRERRIHTRRGPIHCTGNAAG